MSRLRSGLALVETILYIAVLVLMTGLVAGTLIGMTKSYLHFRVSRALTHTATVSLERIIYEIKQAESVGIGSIFDVEPARLVLNTTIGGSPALIEFFASSTELYINDGSEEENLLPPTVRLESLIFRRITTSESEAIKVEMVISDKRATTTPLTLRSTAVIRGTYEE